MIHGSGWEKTRYKIIEQWNHDMEQVFNSMFFPIDGFNLKSIKIKLKCFHNNVCKIWST